MSEDVLDSGRPDIQNIRLQVKQLLRAKKFLSIWLIFLSFVYLFLTAISWKALTPGIFQANANYDWTPEYCQDLYQYAVDIEEMKILHAISFIAISVFMYALVSKNKVLTKKQYGQLLCLTVFFTLLYFVPVVYISKISMERSGKENGGRIFADWMFMLLSESDINVVGLSFNIFVHLQIYMVLYSM